MNQNDRTDKMCHCSTLSFLVITALICLAISKGNCAAIPADIPFVADCKDHDLVDCHVIRGTKECHNEWVYDFCPVSCGVCGMLKPDTSGTCKDLNNECDSIQSAAHENCKDIFIKEMCPKSCGVCGHHHHTQRPNHTPPHHLLKTTVKITTKSPTTLPPKTSPKDTTTNSATLTATAHPSTNSPTTTSNNLQHVESSYRQSILTTPSSSFKIYPESTNTFTNSLPSVKNPEQLISASITTSKASSTTATKTKLPVIDTFYPSTFVESMKSTEVALTSKAEQIAPSSSFTQAVMHTNIVKHSEHEASATNIEPSVNVVMNTDFVEPSVNVVMNTDFVEPSVNVVMNTDFVEPSVNVVMNSDFVEHSVKVVMNTAFVEPSVNVMNSDFVEPSVNVVMNSDIVEPSVNVVMNSDLIEPSVNVVMNSDIVEPSVNVVMNTYFVEPSVKVVMNSDFVEPSVNVVMNSDIVERSVNVVMNSDFVEPETSVNVVMNTDFVEPSVKVVMNSDIVEPSQKVNINTGIIEPSVYNHNENIPILNTVLHFSKSYQHTGSYSETLFTPNLPLEASTIVMGGLGSYIKDSISVDGTTHTIQAASQSIIEEFVTIQPTSLQFAFRSDGFTQMTVSAVTTTDTKISNEQTTNHVQMTTNHAHLSTDGTTMDVTIRNVTTNSGELSTGVMTTSVPMLKKRINCRVCDDPFCDLGFANIHECNIETPFCMNTVRFEKDGTKRLDKRCASDPECNEKWLQKSSKIPECVNFDQTKYYQGPLTCNFCCVTDGCNIHTLPNKDTLYTGK